MAKKTRNESNAASGVSKARPSLALSPARSDSARSAHVLPSFHGTLKVNQAKIDGDKHVDGEEG